MPIERSVVYLDYFQTMHLLRGGLNRVRNTIHGRGHHPETGAECLALCDKIYDAHVAALTEAVQQLRHAVETVRDRELVKRRLNELHRLNRQTVRITHVFADDMDPNHDPIGDEEEHPPPRDPTIPIELAPFRDKLLALVDAPLPSKAPRPRTPGVPL